MNEPTSVSRLPFFTAAKNASPGMVFWKWSASWLSPRTDDSFQVAAVDQAGNASTSHLSLPQKTADERIPIWPAHISSDGQRIQVRDGHVVLIGLVGRNTHIVWGLRPAQGQTGGAQIVDLEHVAVFPSRCAGVGGQTGGELALGGMALRVFGADGEVVLGPGREAFTLWLCGGHRVKAHPVLSNLVESDHHIVICGWPRQKQAIGCDLGAGPPDPRRAR